MRKFQSSSVKALAFSASAIAFAIAGPAYAQDAEDGQDEEEVEITEEGGSASAPQGGIVVTGSRIRRDTYTSISPIQVLETEAANNVGSSTPRKFCSVTKLLLASRLMRLLEVLFSITGRVHRP